MSVIIRELKKPTTCKECFELGIPDMLWASRIATCLLAIGGKKNTNVSRIPEDCPLIEIPDGHGPLIDLDEFRSDFGMGEECSECEKKHRGAIKKCEYDRIFSRMDFCGWLDSANVLLEKEKNS